MLRVIEFYMIEKRLVGFEIKRVMEFEVKVYSMRSHSWKKIEQWPNKEMTPTEVGGFE